MVTKVFLEHPLLVLTREPTDRKKCAPRGLLEWQLVDKGAVPYYTCMESDAFLNSSAHRGDVASEIASWLSDLRAHPYVYVHKPDYAFVLAQLGLVDELLKLVPAGVPVQLVLPRMGRDEILERMDEVLAARRNDRSRGCSPDLLREFFENMVPVSLTDIVEALDHRKDADSTSAAGC